MRRSEKSHLRYAISHCSNRVPTAVPTNNMEQHSIYYIHAQHYLLFCVNEASPLSHIAVRLKFLEYRSDEFPEITTLSFNFGRLKRPCVLRSLFLCCLSSDFYLLPANDQGESVSSV